MEQVIYRAMERGDIDCILDTEYPTGYSSKRRKDLEKHFDEQERNLRTVIIAEQNGEFAGRVTLAPSTSSGAFKHKNIPIIHDLNVIEKFRQGGIGTELMNRIEESAAKLSGTVCLGVGISEYSGAAQRLFVKRGYIPDGSGAWYGRQPAHLAGRIEEIGNLTLYMSKNLR